MRPAIDRNYFQETYSKQGSEIFQCGDLREVKELIDGGLQFSLTISVLLGCAGLFLVAIGMTKK